MYGVVCSVLVELGIWLFAGYRVELGKVFLLGIVWSWVWGCLLGIGWSWLCVCLLGSGWSWVFGCFLGIGWNWVVVVCWI